MPNLEDVEIEVLEAILLLRKRGYGITPPTSPEKKKETKKETRTGTMIRWHDPGPIKEVPWGYRGKIGIFCICGDANDPPPLCMIDSEHDVQSGRCAKGQYHAVYWVVCLDCSNSPSDEIFHEDVEYLGFLKP